MQQIVKLLTFCLNICLSKTTRSHTHTHARKHQHVRLCVKIFNIIDTQPISIAHNMAHLCVGCSLNLRTFCSVLRSHTVCTHCQCARNKSNCRVQTYKTTKICIDLYIFMWQPKEAAQQKKPCKCPQKTCSTI